MIVTIVGNGVVGRATQELFDTRFIIDPAMKDSNTYEDPYKYGSKIGVVFYICVPTPTDNYFQDTLIIDSVVKSIREAHDNYDRKTSIVIRSTVLPGTTERYQQENPDIKFFHMPEFLTESSMVQDACDTSNLIVGTRHKFDVEELLIMSSHTANVPKLGAPIITDSTSSELAKYALNTFFGSKVVLGNVFKDLANHYGCNYEITKNLLENHKWGSKNGWNPYHGNHRGYGGKCLPKDIQAISRMDKTGLLRKMDDVNTEYAKIKI